MTFIAAATESSMTNMNLMLRYDGHAVTAYAQINNTEGGLQPIGSVTVSFSADALIGFAVTSHDSSTFNTAVFDEFGSQ